MPTIINLSIRCFFSGELRPLTRSNFRLSGARAAIYYLRRNLPIPQSPFKNVLGLEKNQNNNTNAHEQEQEGRSRSALALRLAVAWDYCETLSNAATNHRLSLQQLHRSFVAGAEQTPSNHPFINLVLVRNSGKLLPVTLINCNRVKDLIEQVFRNLKNNSQKNLEDSSYIDFEQYVSIFTRNKRYRILLLEQPLPHSFIINYML